jgi:tRNA pseudouridine55 synthase
MRASRTRTNTTTRKTTTSPEPAGRGPRSGIVVIDKPAGWTSHQVVGRIRRIAGTRKVGHAGTLDPMATGVLVVGVNRATRLLGHLMLTEKAYEATIRLGVSTLSDDADGDVVASPGAELGGSAGITLPQLIAQMRPLTGEILQVPTAVSAIKVDGVRSYVRVRTGAEVDLVARRVMVSRFDLVDYRAGRSGETAVVDLDVAVECSSGTYVRALARDLGASLGTGGHLTRLRRTRVGPYAIAQAQTLDEAAAALDLVDIADVAAATFPVVVVDVALSDCVRNGRRLEDFSLGAPRAALFSDDGDFLALYRQAGATAVPESVFVLPR